MKPFSRLIFAITASLALSFCTPGIIEDGADILSAEAKQTLESLVLQWNQATHHQMAIVTIKSLGDISIEEFAVKRLEAMGVGRKGVNDGLLLMVAPHDRRMRIEVGYGLEDTLPDGLTGEIRDRYILPFFKNGKFEAGILAGTLALISIQAKNEGVAFSPSLDKPIPQPLNQQSKTDWGGIIFIVIMVIVIIFSKGGRSGGLWPLLFLGSMMGGSGRYNDRSGFGGFGGGGFGGFGGGMSGGGGSSGGW